MKFAKPTKFHRKSEMWGTQLSSENQRTKTQPSLRDFPFPKRRRHP